MVAFGEHLKANIAQEYGADAYLDYQGLDNIIQELSRTAPSGPDLQNRMVSLTTPPQTDARGLAVDNNSATEEQFLSKMDFELAKVEKFTLQKVSELRKKIDDTEKAIGTEEKEKSEARADEISNDFLLLEKYVNINFMGFHKILKKHDKNLPSYPCKAFYVSRMHAQAWVRGDYSDLVVRLSHIYSSLRDDQVAEENNDQQSFLRQTTKYWVKTEDVSRVKYYVLRHLPVFLQKTSTGESDSQFTNSVYLDNDQLELYHGRLEKAPGAIALRLRWYGNGDPKQVFVERKTHNDKWTGEVSVKERFVVDESEVYQVLTNTYPIEKKKAEMLAKGKSQKECDEWEQLVREITQVCVSKQLVPTVRTQCMRTAFQIPFDATVRISLDTNLCMISERGYDLNGMKTWHRNPEWILQPNEITRFPHAVLEIKLELKGGNMTAPKWVSDLQNSGLIYECHKYSKYCHGCAVLLPEDVRSVPYWVDDISLRDSIIASGGGRILMDPAESNPPGANAIYDHLLPFGDANNDRSGTAVGRTHVSAAASKGITKDKATVNNIPTGFDMYDPNAGNIMDTNEEEGCCSWVFPFCSRYNNYAEAIVAPTSFQKIEPKVYFANERTYLHWLHYGVILSSIAAGILSFSDDSGESWGQWYALALLPVSLGFCLYALHIFLWRQDQIKNRIPARWDDPMGPILLGSTVAVILIINFCTQVYEIAKIDFADDL
ncbi:VTC vacuolar transport domain containing protein [Nitzschia inconspicua]|uniref:VTC vacuolar transport domain containing protein n=1 Tax=Nitzschia inconspicua TaxID=303405 RepID=A0A9K3KVW9_9STRA|nr:VTC vacuolar transport domain containing protein [Nitzschia inconspicua]